MLTSFLATVRKYALVLFLAVFFAGPATAGDSSLYSLEAGLNELIYNLSRSLVTVEGIKSIPSCLFTEPKSDALRRLVCSGLIVDTSGHVLVAAESVLGQDQIIVDFEDHRVPAELLAVDYYNDLALLGVKQRFGKPVVCSDRHSCAGQIVIAMGNAYGLRVSPSIGLCAGVRSDGKLQFSVPVASGAIGGGIFDLSGRLLGLIMGGIGEWGQMAVAVPAYKIAPIVEYMLTHGDRHAGYAGITTREIRVIPPIEISYPNKLMSAVGRVNERIDAGVVVTSVVPASPAARSGLRKGDIVFGVGDRRIRSVVELSSLIRQCEPDMTVNLEVIRVNTPYSIPLTIGRRDVLRSSRALAGSSRLEEREQIADSLARMFKTFKEEVSRLERRLNNLD